MVGIVLVEDGNGVCTNDGTKGNAYGCKQIYILLCAYIFYQLHQHFGVGIAFEFYAIFLKLLLQNGIVLNDTIVNDGKIACKRNVWVCIGGIGLTMSRPTCMGNADGSANVFVRGIGFQISHLAFRFVNS